MPKSGTAYIYHKYVPGSGLWVDIEVYSGDGVLVWTVSLPEEALEQPSGTPVTVEYDTHGAARD